MFSVIDRFLNSLFNEFFFCVNSAINSNVKCELVLYLYKWLFFSECRSKREMPSLYPHAKGILHALKNKGIDVAVASRSPSPDIANTFLEKLNIKSMFVAKVSPRLLLL